MFTQILLEHWRWSKAKAFVQVIAVRTYTALEKLVALIVGKICFLVSMLKSNTHIYFHSADTFGSFNRRCLTCALSNSCGYISGSFSHNMSYFLLNCQGSSMFESSLCLAYPLKDVTQGSLSTMKLQTAWVQNFKVGILLFLLHHSVPCARRQCNSVMINQPSYKWPILQFVFLICLYFQGQYTLINITTSVPVGLIYYHRVIFQLLTPGQMLN